MNRLLNFASRMNLSFSLFLSSVLLNFPSIHSLASEGPSNVVYQGRIFKPDSSALEASSVLFDVSVYSPDGVCLLYEESHSVNMTGTGGSFSLTLGMGAPIGPLYSVKEVLSNVGSFTGGGSCSYTPVSGHSRIIRVTFDDGGGPIALQDQLIQSVPYALYASKLEGKGKSDFLQINTTTSSLSQANANSLFQSATYTELMALAGGTSTVFAKSADLPVSSGVLNLSGAGQGVRVLDTPAGGDYAVNKNYSDGKIGGKSIDAANFAGLANGESVKWDTTANSGLGGWVRYTPASTGNTVINGGQAGAVSLGSTDANSLTLKTNNSSRVTIDSNGNMGVGTTSPSVPLQVYAQMPWATGPKALTVTNQTNPTTMAGAGGLLVDWDGGGGIYMSDSTAGISGKYEAYGGALGIGTISNHPVRISANNTVAITVDTNQKVGFGTTTPAEGLHVSGADALISTSNMAAGSQIYLRSTSGGGVIEIKDMDDVNSVQGEVKFTDAAGTAVGRIGGFNLYTNNEFGIRSNKALRFDSSNTTRMIINASGNVGIGNTSPSSKLEVTGSIISTPANIPSGASVDLAISNTMTLDAVGGPTINLSNMVHGGTYTLVIKDTTSRTYTFSGCNTSKYKPTNGSTLNGSWSVFTILTLYNGSTYDCVITWATGYQ